MFKELIKVANTLDQKGFCELADRLDKVIIRLAEEEEESSSQAEEDESVSKEVAEAIDRSVGMSHFEKTFLTRNPGGESEGSIFSEPQNAESLKAATWMVYNHPDILAPAQGYRADIAGTFGLVRLDDLSPDTPVKAVLGHKGETEFVTILVDRANVPSNLTNTDFTTMLLGPGDDGLIVWTFHPGPPVAPSAMTPSAETEDVKIATDAMNLGFEYAKVATF